MSRQSDKHITRQVRIDKRLHLQVKLYATENALTIKEVLESIISDYLSKELKKQKRVK